MNLGLMKMAVLGSEKADRTSEKMGTDVGGLGWAVDLMMLLLSGLKRYNMFFLYFNLTSSLVFFLVRKPYEVIFVTPSSITPGGRF